ncbi:hypothetical protein [Cellulophaga sp. Z1A5H]|uniref:hypothetical protein n=1 Tax=Cellulophaga sp. Z1A5H TaxID=2687291 RepID=UPI0013FDDDAB|nr:hypothetical protein [Cellulophaga sp. Z1A5H]
MLQSIRTKIAATLITSNLILGNGILFIGGKSSFTEAVNYPLMGGMSMACIILYTLFFYYSKFETYSKFKLILLSVLSCMAIILLGCWCTVLLKEPIAEFFTNIPTALLMGIMGNIMFFPVSIILGLLNFGIISYYKNKKNVISF